MVMVFVFFTLFQIYVMRAQFCVVPPKIICTSFFFCVCVLVVSVLDAFSIPSFILSVSLSFYPFR